MVDRPVAPAADPPLAVVAADVGNSKTDVALVRADGSVAAVARGASASHQVVGLDRCLAALESCVATACSRAGIDASRRPLARIVVSCAAGADLPSDERRLAGLLAASRLGADAVVRNDTFGPLRAGTPRAWGVGVVCGHGINCIGVAPDGRTARFDALGSISGDWGGGGAVGDAALSAAVRAQDGRGPTTALERLVPQHFGLSRPRSVTIALYRGRLDEARLAELAPVVFEAAASGDAVARHIVDRLADEIVAWVGSAIRRLRMQRLDVHVVLGGGVFRARDAAFYERIAAGVTAVAPRAELRRLTAPPVLGAALIGLDSLAGGRTPDAIEARVRAGLTEAAMATG